MNVRCSKWLVISLVLAAAFPAFSDDWPSYMHDRARSGVTSEEIALPLQEAWVFLSALPPAPAWGDPQPKAVEGNLELPRVKFDDAYHAISAMNRVFFGTSSDNTIYCLDAVSGKVLWKRILGGPIRLAPTFFDGKVYVGSDDGFAYCFDAEDGSETWRFQAGPTAERLLGHGRMISMWPLRTGILVDGGVAYFAAGVFPHEGVFLYAVDAATGTLIWLHDAFGYRGGEGISPQGYLLASDDLLYVPSGRSTPAVFRRGDGQFLHQSRGNWRADGLFGGTYALLSADHLYGGTEQITAYDAKTGRSGFAWFHGRRLILTDDTAFLQTDHEVSAIPREPFPDASQARQVLRRKMPGLQSKEWSLKSAIRTSQAKLKTDPSEREKLEGLEKQMEALLQEKEDVAQKLERAGEAIQGLKKWRVSTDWVEAMALSDGALFIGGADAVAGLDRQTGEILWQGEVEGSAKGIIASNQRIIVSTSTGAIHCFVPGTEKKDRGVVNAVPKVHPFPEKSREDAFFSTVDGILENSPVPRGYALVLGSDVAPLTSALSQKADLVVYGLTNGDGQREAIYQIRDRVCAAGLYGKGVFIDQKSSEELPYSDYFANLIICQPSEDGQMPVSPDELLRVLKPQGGVAYIGQAPGLQENGTRLKAKDLRKWLNGLPPSHVEMKKLSSTWVQITRGKLEGAGNWTHQYAEPGNTACSDDELVKAPLGLLWYGDPGPGRMPSRHASAAAPLSYEGRLFIQGEHVIMAHDAYNGVKLWEREITGALRLGTKTECGNLAVSEDGLFVATGGSCLRLDLDTGETLHTYSVPSVGDDKKRFWAHVSLVDGALYGSGSISWKNSDVLFSYDVASGEARWIHQGKSMMHISMAMGDGKFFLVEGSVSQEERASVDASAEATVRKAMALNSLNGDVLWQKPVDLTNCIKIGAGGGEVSTIYKDNVLLLCMAPWNGHFWREFMAGEFSRRSIIALRGDTGEAIWSDKVGYRSRPLVVRDKIYAEPWARDLQSGEPVMRKNPITDETVPWQFFRPGHHCGCIAAAPNCLFFRSLTTAYYDLIRDEGTSHFTAQRPGCWINFIAANGLLLLPEASSGCVCAFPIHCTVALQPREKNRAWSIYSSLGKKTPVQRLSLNLGGPGDRKGTENTLWLSYPRPAGGRLAYDVAATVKFAEGGGYFVRNPDVQQIERSEDPWLFASGCSGLQELSVPLVGEGEGPGMYTVKLHFAEMSDVEAGQRVFDVSIQGKTVLTNFDVVKEAGGLRQTLMKSFSGLQVRRDIVLRFVPKNRESDGTDGPLLNAVEFIREETAEQEDVLGTLDKDIPSYRMGFWAADLLKRETEADIALLPGRALWDCGATYPEGDVTLGNLQGFLGDRRIVLADVKGQKLLEYIQDAMVRDRLNPFHRSAGAKSGNPLYYSGMKVSYVNEGDVLSLDIVPAKIYKMAVVWPYGEALKYRGETPPKDDVEKGSPIPGLTVQSVEIPADSTWDLMERASKGKRLKLDLPYVEPVKSWTPWLARIEERLKSIETWPAEKPTIVVDAVEDAGAALEAPKQCLGTRGDLTHDGGDQAMGDNQYKVFYIKFPLNDVPGRPITAKLRLKVTSGEWSGSADAGAVYLVDDDWSEKTLTYEGRPPARDRVGELGKVDIDQTVECHLMADLRGKDTLSIVIEPTSIDAAAFHSKEGSASPQLIIAYDPR